MPPDDRRNPSTSAERQLFGEIMHALYGEAWPEPAARDLNIRDRRVLLRMANGEHHGPSGGPWPIPAGIWHELAALLEAEQSRLGELAVRARSELAADD